MNCIPVQHPGTPHCTGIRGPAEEESSLDILGLSTWTKAVLSRPSRTTPKRCRLPGTRGPAEGRDVLGHIGLVHMHQGRFEQAIAHYTQALQIAREVGDRRGEGHRLGNLGIVHVHQGRFEHAIVPALTALQIAREREEGLRLGHLGVVPDGKAVSSRPSCTSPNQIVPGNRESEGRQLGNLGKLHNDARTGLCALASGNSGIGIASSLEIFNINQGRFEQAIANTTQASDCALGDRRSEGVLWKSWDCARAPGPS